MLKDIVESRWEDSVEYELIFYRDGTGGYGFPCDREGNVFPLEHEAARENLKYCLEHPDEFERWNEVETIRHHYCVPAHGRCSCGREVELRDEYYGACSCECGRWYNMFGQELRHPKYWMVDPAEEEYWD